MPYRTLKEANAALKLAKAKTKEHGLTRGQHIYRYYRYKRILAEIAYFKQNGQWLKLKIF
jgi:hypothetical protein